MKSHRVLERSQRGFSLIELMIVIAVIAILVGVGIPAWQAMTRSGNEAATTQSIDTIRKLQVQYAAKHQGNFAPTFDELIKILDFDPKFKGERPVVNGYIYSLKVQERTQSQPAFYSVNADPQVAEGITRTGDRHFYFDSTLSTIRQTEENRPAKADDPSI
ncbi:MAG: prepilin-type N-terminal cleavage/methylation domain-containing protein [Acidobacteria bacterium]|nr:MAG: prepilin-type N-terminal cleavage/methylation domain-containing protein [Acidobacteriota bacterium]REK02568.1 MAG: prepilin-type N-terminal cleavage/methylation domain-containing protein [Acidobacteriota bacterium]REK13629.1 MAG: prepilin-type N-terminal cleavage/methylation domain-containing protein [Acidobacteriota bacterium]REK41623.1 MAG: prepilin-type N-terminal cleavage/methylation domain-containing protein [Acidobacteriota bacterium]